MAACFVTVTEEEIRQMNEEFFQKMCYPPDWLILKQLSPSASLPNGLNSYVIINH